MTTQAVDLSQVTLPDAYDLAILIDEEAAERYEEFASQLEVHHTPEAAAFFHAMAEDETAHVDMLREQRFGLFPYTPCRVCAPLVRGVKAPDYDEVRAFMTLRQAMETAAHAEERADAFWRSAAERAMDAEARELFWELHAEETREEERVKTCLGALPPDLEWRAEDFADEPTGH